MKEIIDPIRKNSLIHLSQQHLCPRSHYCEIYDIMFMNFESLINSSTPLTEKKISVIKGLLNEMISNLPGDYNEILKLTLVPNQKKFQIYNSLNVCLLSILIGKALNYSDQELLELGFAALMHDLGMFAIEGLIYSGETFNQEHRQMLQQHPVSGLHILDQFIKVTENIEKAVIQEHEREDGSGYPEGINGKNIHEFAKIIAIADCFESLTHFRPYRKCVLPVDALQSILQLSKSQFDRIMANGMINALSLYPPGTCVRLADGEIGIVTKVNPGSPLSPSVAVYYDRHGRECRGEIQTIDLLEDDENYILRIIDLEAIDDLNALDSLREYPEH
ncbi:MAG: HD domain-containing protein [Candidatus Omnitrophica bacterium]|nr:HD domain-containing protein [Candidatus Omnitrophota bacterium]